MLGRQNVWFNIQFSNRQLLARLFSSGAHLIVEGVEVLIPVSIIRGSLKVTPA